MEEEPYHMNPIQNHDLLKNSLLSIEWTLNAFSNYIYIIGTMHFTKEVCKFTAKRKDGVYNVTHREPYQHRRFSCSECLRKRESFEQKLEGELVLKNHAGVSGPIQILKWHAISKIQDKNLPLWEQYGGGFPLNPIVDSRPWTCCMWTPTPTWTPTPGVFCTKVQAR